MLNANNLFSNKAQPATVPEVLAEALPESEAEVVDELARVAELLGAAYDGDDVTAIKSLRERREALQRHLAQMAEYRSSTAIAARKREAEERAANARALRSQLTERATRAASTIEARTRALAASWSDYDTAVKELQQLEGESGSESVDISRLTQTPADFFGLAEMALVSVKSLNEYRTAKTPEPPAAATALSPFASIDGEPFAYGPAAVMMPKSVESGPVGYPRSTLMGR